MYMRTARYRPPYIVEIICDICDVCILGSAAGASWPLHDIATANIVWCMAYTRGAGWGSYIAH